MSIKIYNWDVSEGRGLDILKVKFCKNPNEKWSNGLGFCICNHSLLLYWGKR